MMKVSPSRLDRLAVCPRYVYDDRDTAANEARQDAMDAGTQFHQLMEELVQTPDKLAFIAAVENQDMRRSCEWTWPHLEGILAAGGAFCGVEQEAPESSACRRGFIDLRLSMDGKPWNETQMPVVVDYKYLRAEGDHDWQMKGYVVSAFEELPLATCVRVLVITPKIEKVCDETYERSAHPSLVKQIQGLMELVENPFTPGRPSEICRGCRWAGRCPAQAAVLAPESTTVAMSMPQRLLLEPATPAERAMRRYFADWLASWIEGVKEDDKEAVLSGIPPPPGYKLISTSGALSLPNDRMPEAVDRMIAAGVPLNAILAACKLSFPKLSASQAEVLSQTPDEVRESLDKLVRDLLIPGAPSTYLKRTSKKSPQQLFKDLETPAIAG